MGLAGTGNITDLLLGPDTRLTYPPGPYKAKSNIIYDPISDEGLEVIKNYIIASNAPSYLEFNSLGVSACEILDRFEESEFGLRSHGFHFVWGLL
jgi:hypothetical protein